MGQRLPFGLYANKATSKSKSLDLYSKASLGNWYLNRELMESVVQQEWGREVKVNKEETVRTSRCKTQRVQTLQSIQGTTLSSVGLEKCKYKGKRNKGVSVFVLFRGSKQGKGKRNIWGFGFSGTHSYFSRNNVMSQFPWNPTFPLA